MTEVPSANPANKMVETLGIVDVDDAVEQVET
jgi:hypothetical protein